MKNQTRYSIGRILIGLLLIMIVSCNQSSGIKDQAPQNQQEIDHTTEKQSSPEPTNEKTMTSVVLKTNKGDIEIELDSAKAPKTVENFLNYVNQGHYNEVIFHRVIPGFMIQGGGFTADMDQKATQGPIPNEADNGLTNDKYTIAMARTSDPHSATAQFFINTNQNDFLNFKSTDMQGWGYAVFGEVTSGKDVVDTIEMVSTGRVGPHGDVPLEAVIIHSVEIK